MSPRMPCRIVRSAGAVLGAVLLAGAAGCSDDGKGGSREPGVISPGETLLAAPPEGWKSVFATSNPGLRTAEYIPEDDDNAEWREKISFESLAGKPLPDPLVFVNGISEDTEGTCEDFRAYPLSSKLENGYPTAVHLLVCGRMTRTDQSQVTMIKAIQGNENFYVVTRSRRGPPLAEGAEPLTEAEVGGWSLYLRAISVCDTQRPEHPCPGQASVGEAAGEAG